MTTKSYIYRFTLGLMLTTTTFQVNALERFVLKAMGVRGTEEISNDQAKTMLRRPDVMGSQIYQNDPDKKEKAIDLVELLHNDSTMSVEQIKSEAGVERTLVELGLVDAREAITPALKQRGILVKQLGIEPTRESFNAAEVLTTTQAYIDADLVNPEALKAISELRAKGDDAPDVDAVKAQMESDRLDKQLAQLKKDNPEIEQAWRLAEIEEDNEKKDIAVNLKGVLGTEPLPELVDRAFMAKTEEEKNSLTRLIMDTILGRKITAEEVEYLDSNKIPIQAADIIKALEIFHKEKEEDSADSDEEGNAEAERQRLVEENNARLVEENKKKAEAARLLEEATKKADEDRIKAEDAERQRVADEEAARRAEKKIPTTAKKGAVSPKLQNQENYSLEQINKLIKDAHVGTKDPQYFERTPFTYENSKGNQKKMIPFHTTQDGTCGLLAMGIKPEEFITAMSGAPQDIRDFFADELTRYGGTYEDLINEYDKGNRMLQFTQDYELGAKYDGNPDTYGDIAEKSEFAGSVGAAAKYFKKNVRIWERKRIADTLVKDAEKDSPSELSLSAKYSFGKPKEPFIDIMKVASDDGHFNLLVEESNIEGRREAVVKEKTWTEMTREALKKAGTLKK